MVVRTLYAIDKSNVFDELSYFEPVKTAYVR